MADGGIDPSNPLYDAVQRGKSDPDSLRFEGDDDSGGSSRQSDSRQSRQDDPQDIEGVRSPSPDEVLNGESGGRQAADRDFSTNPRPGDTADTVSGNSGNGGGGDAGMPDETGDMPEDSGTAARKLDGSTGSNSGSGGGGGGRGGGGGTPAGLSAPPSGLEETGQSRDPADIEPSANGTGPDPTQGVEDGGQFQSQARSLEDEQLASLEDQTGREFTDEDVRVTSSEQDGQTRLEAELTSTGQEKINREQFQREFQAKQQLEQQIQAQTDEQLTRGDDFVIEESTGEDGQTVFEVDFETGPRDTDVSPSVSRGTESSGDLPDADDGDIFSGTVAGTEDALSEVAQVASGDESTTVEFRGEGSIVNRARQQEAEASGDRFGDTDLTLPFTDIEVGATAAAGAELFDERVAQPVGDVTGDIGDITQSGAAVFGASNPLLLATGRTSTQQIEQEVEQGDERLADVGRAPENENSSERTLETFAQGAGTGAANIANVPAVANTGIEAGEFAIEAGEQTAGGRGGEFAGAAAGAGALLGARTAKAAAENPVSFTGQVVGSTVASGGAIGAARKAGGPGAARAASAAIQPGEELAIAAARSGAISKRAASAVPGVNRRQFVKESAGGSGDPLVDIEIEGSGRTAVESTDFRSDDSLLSPVSDRVPDSVRSFVSDRRGQAGGGGRRTRQRQRQRQRQQQEQEPVIEIDVGNDPLVRGLERDSQASKSSFESSSRSDIETRLEADSRARAVQRLESEARLQAAQSESVGLGAVFGPSLSSRQSAGVDDITEPTATTELGIEPATTTRTETGQESATELSIELATETRAETRTELLGESRREVQPDALLEDESGLGTSAGGEGDTATKSFEYNIATPDEVLSGSTGIDL